MPGERRARSSRRGVSGEACRSGHGRLESSRVSPGVGHASDLGAAALFRFRNARMPAAPAARRAIDIVPGSGTAAEPMSPARMGAPLSSMAQSTTVMLLGNFWEAFHFNRIQPKLPPKVLKPAKPV